MNGKILFSIVMILLFNIGIATTQDSMQEDPMAASVNQEIKAQDAAVVLEHVFLYPNDRSLYGPGEKNYGMPVSMEYGKGPVVVVDIKKEPDHISILGIGSLSDWLQVELYSDGKPLQRKSVSSSGVFGFNFWVDDEKGQTYELNELGDVECKVKLYSIVKVCDIPVDNVSRSPQPFFEDEDIRVWDVKWEEREKSYADEPETRIEAGIETKTKFVTLRGIFIRKDSEEQLRPTSSSQIEPSDTLEEARISFSRFIDKDKLLKAELWKIVPVIEKTFPLKFVPQKDIFEP